MPEGGYERRFGDRRDGRLLRTLPPITRLTPYLTDSRYALEYAGTAAVGPAEDWLRAARAAGWQGIGFLHLFLAAYVRTVSRYPHLNRFVSGQKLFARDGIAVVMSVKRPPAAGDEEALLKVSFDPADTVFDVYRKLSAKVDAINAGEDRGRPEQTAETFMNIPGPLLKFTVWFLNLLDYFGLLPRSLAALSPWHASLNVADLATTGGEVFYRPLNGLGNLTASAALGARQRGPEGDYIDYRLTLDGRVAGAAYFSEALGNLKHLLEHPAELETPPDTVRQDVM